MDLPAGSTPLDFAYHIHSDVGIVALARKLVGASCRLPTSYRWAIKLKLSPEQPNPSRDWLNPNLGYVTTSRGRSKIHASFRKQDRDKNILAGRQILDDELAHWALA